ncbi:MAG: 7-cyano-7-deazaguanine synthase QueC, partial [Coxiellaceae bacterium]|nr:7-cyano-7-deazaguanine synthase QueC [Coxiellaceae bacterium]
MSNLVKEKKAIILLSGGIDSTTTLALVSSQGFVCYALSIAYGQRNYPELASAKQSVEKHGAVEHRIVDVNINDWGGSALTDHTLEIPKEASNDIPMTYVPARNTVMLSIALSWAEAIGAHDIFYGANHVDYSNYPDCRPDYIAAFETMANLATRDGREGKPFRIHAPLLEMNKAEIIALGTKLGVDYSTTVSCYDPDQDGLACGVCDACRFRAKGFSEAGIE